MKIFISFALLLASFIASPPNEVDGLKTAKDVENFIQGQSPAYANAHLAYRDFLYSNATSKKIADSLGVKLWQKADFNNNGKTDLLAYISNKGQRYLTVFMDEGGSFSIHTLSKWPFAYTFYPVVEKRDSLTLLVLYKTCSYCYGGSSLFDADTLIYKFGNFIEYTPKEFPFGNHRIESIKFSTSPCYGTCPVFEIDVTANRKAQYHAISYNDTTGVFTTVINAADYNKIVEILNYIDFPNLYDDYSVTWTDAQSARLTITYDGGKTKNIYDYGESGTYGLSTVYNLLYNLRINQKWKRIQE